MSEFVEYIVKGCPARPNLGIKCQKTGRHGKARDLKGESIFISPELYAAWTESYGDFLQPVTPVKEAPSAEEPEKAPSKPKGRRTARKKAED